MNKEELDKLYEALSLWNEVQVDREKFEMVYFFDKILRELTNDEFHVASVDSEPTFSEDTSWLYDQDFFDMAEDYENTIKALVRK